jgi:hypothetical protein
LGTESLMLGLYPEPAGLMPFGTLGAAWFTWRTQGPPSDWRVTYIWSYESDGYHPFDVGFAEFMTGLLRHSIVLPGTEDNWEAGAGIEFIPEPGLTAAPESSPQDNNNPD